MNSSCSKSQNWVLIFWVDLLHFFKGANISTDTSQSNYFTYFVCACLWVCGCWLAHVAVGYNLEELNHLTLLGYLLPVCGLILIGVEDL